MKSKLNWTTEEEQTLKEEVQSRKCKTWKDIAEMMNSRFPTKKCTGKQYRQRYMNHTQFGIQKTQNFSWTPQEQKLLFSCYDFHGPSWSLIVQKFPHKSENCLKNKFYGSIRKMQRKLNKFIKESKQKNLKQIKYESIVKILNAAEGANDLSPDVKQSSIKIKKTIISLSQTTPEFFDQEDAFDLIKVIYKFNVATRCFNSKKWRKKSQKNSNGKERKKNMLDPQKLTYFSSCQKVNERQEFEFKTLQQLGSTKEKNESSDQKQKNKQDIDASGTYSEKQEDKSQLNQLPPHESNDLEFDLCQILQREYRPQQFYFFQ